MIKTIIAGPCSVENREQLRIVTEALAAMPRVGLIRAGVWKPRTRPGGFEGLGEPALQWMQAFAAEYGVRYCCEVATPDHVALCQRYGIGTVVGLAEIPFWQRKIKNSDYQERIDEVKRKVAENTEKQWNNIKL